MTIDDELILKLEKLARLRLEDEERKELEQDLNEILAMVDKLHELNTDQVEPLVYINQDSNEGRKDIVSGELKQEAALKNAPLHQNGYFKVPKVLKIKSK